jgi:hypothetical protein
MHALIPLLRRKKAARPLQALLLHSFLCETPKDPQVAMGRPLLDTYELDFGTPTKGS